VTGCVLVCLSTLTLHHVGAPQYLSVFFVLLPLWVSEQGGIEELNTSVKLTLSLFISWVTLYVIFYDLTGYYEEGFSASMRDLAGLIHFPLAVILFVSIWKYSTQKALQEKGVPLSD
jgi:hypothetical protein